MKILYCDLAAAAFPTGRGDGFRSHCVRISALLEEDGEIIGHMNHLIKPHKDWDLGESAHAYHRASSHDFADDGVDVAVVAEKLRMMMQDVMIIVSHNTQHHQRLLNAIWTDAGLVAPPAIAHHVCTMKGSTDICKMRLVSQGKWKSPKLKEAFKFFTGADMREPIGWYTFGEVQVRAVRAVYHGIQKRQGAGTSPRPMHDDDQSGTLFGEAGY
jgi:hypothetical protein